MSGADGSAPAGVVQARRAWQQLGLRLQSVTPRALVRFLLVVGALAVIVWLLASAWSVLTPFIVVMQTVQDNVLSPKIMGDSLNIHPAIVMPLVVILGRNGILWIILAGPAAALARDLFLYVYGRFEDPPRPAGLLPGEPLPLLETCAQVEVVPVERTEPGPVPPGAPSKSSVAPASWSQPRA